jgi:hypothetical protein
MGSHIRGLCKLYQQYAAKKHFELKFDMSHAAACLCDILIRYNYVQRSGQKHTGQEVCQLQSTQVFLKMFFVQDLYVYMLNKDAQRYQGYAKYNFRGRPRMPLNVLGRPGMLKDMRRNVRKRLLSLLIPFSLGSKLL